MAEVSFLICSVIKFLFGREDKSRESKLAGVMESQAYLTQKILVLLDYG